ncbi:MAG: hypothetical protein D6712_00725, partial [Chloroflexi bacterium]
MRKNNFLMITLLAILLTINIGKAQERVAITWMQINSYPDWSSIIEEFNTMQTDITLEYIIPCCVSQIDVLNTLIKNGNPPDIVGEISLNGFSYVSAIGASWLDLSDLIQDNN